LGKPFIVETDHKPLVPLLNTKHLDNMPPRVLRLRLAKFKYVAQHVPGKVLYAADALSRAPLQEGGEEEPQEEVEAYIEHITVPSLPATPSRLQEYKQAQIEDTDCSRVREYIRAGWPGRDTVPSPLKPYWKARSMLTV